MMEQDLTPYMLSKISGVSRTYTYNILNGKMDNPSIAILEKFAMALGLEAITLLK